MFKIIPSKLASSVLTESAQANPIRWAFCKREENALIVKSPWFKCKDYFNDVVAAKHGLFFTQYGFDNKEMSSYEDDGAYVIVNFIYDKAAFKASVSAIMNTDHPIEMENLTGQKVLLFIPEYYFENTYRISILTYLIRMANQPKETPANFESLAQAFSSAFVQSDHLLYPQYKARAASFGWNHPREGECWWMCSPTTHSAKLNSYQKLFEYQSLIHNAGMVSWMRNI